LATQPRLARPTPRPAQRIYLAPLLAGLMLLVIAGSMSMQMADHPRLRSAREMAVARQDIQGWERDAAARTETPLIRQRIKRL
jgi:hypothetical protein